MKPTFNLSAAGACRMPAPSASATTAPAIMIFRMSNSGFLTGGHDSPKRGTRPPRLGEHIYWSMIFSENRYPLFGIMLFWSMIFSENRYPLFGIMLLPIGHEHDAQRRGRGGPGHSASPRDHDQHDDGREIGQRR